MSLMLAAVASFDTCSRCHLLNNTMFRMNVFTFLVIKPLTYFDRYRSSGGHLHVDSWQCRDRVIFLLLHAVHSDVHSVSRTQV